MPPVPELGESAWPHRTGRAATAQVWVANREHTLVVTVNEATAEVK